MSTRHSILVITYRQEDMIGGCLGSILSQSVKPYEVIVCDDCSPDNTWAVIEQYISKYPDLIKGIRHEKNKGLFENYNFTLNQAQGDIISFISGDDIMPEGIIEKYNVFIEQNGLDCNDSFNIFTNSMVLKPDGKLVFKNNKANFNENMFEAVVEQSMWSWETGMSRGLVERVKNTGIRTDMGYQADLLWHLTKIDQTDKNYFLDAVGYIYRANVGVSVATKHEEHLKSKRRVVDQIFKQFPHRITPKVKKFYCFDQAWMEYNAFPDFKNYYHYVRAYFSYGKFPKGNIHNNALKVLLPIWMKKLIKKIIGRKY